MVLVSGVEPEIYSLEGCCIILSATRALYVNTLTVGLEPTTLGGIAKSLISILYGSDP